MKLNAKLRDSNKRIVKLTLQPDGEDDSIFLTKLYKALLFRDEIAFENPDGTYTCYLSGESNVVEDEEI